MARLEAGDLPLAPQAKELVFGATAHQGTYRVSLGTNQLAFCVNLLDPAESNLQPRSSLSIGRFTEVAATTAKRAIRRLTDDIGAKLT